MTEKITQPIAPDIENPAPLGPLSGDWKDDDSAVYEADFVAADHGPEKTVGIKPSVEKIKIATRLIVRNVTVGTVNGALVDPILLLPADVNRKSLQLQAYSAAATTYIIGDSKSDCYNGVALNGGPGVVILTLTDHTGAVWLYSTDVASVDVTAVAVTE
jgi:hypothetical protein